MNTRANSGNRGDWGLRDDGRGQTRLEGCGCRLARDEGGNRWHTSYNTQRVGLGEVGSLGEGVDRLLVLLGLHARSDGRWDGTYGRLGRCNGKGSSGHEDSGSAHLDFVWSELRFEGSGWGVFDRSDRVRRWIVKWQ